MLAKFFVKGLPPVPPQVRDQCKDKLNEKANITEENVWLTIVGIYLCDSQFPDREEEYAGMFSKAIQWLKKKAGLTKPNPNQIITYMNK